MSRKLLIATASLLFVSRSDGQIIGQVIDPHGLPVAKASILLGCGSVNRNLLSDRHGYFTSQLDGASKCVLRVSHPGFKVYSSDVDDSTHVMRIALALADLRQDVTVSSGGGGGLKCCSFPGTVTLTEQDISALPSSSPALVAYASALAGIQPGALIYVDGMPSETLPPPEMISQVTVNSDPFSAEYGEGGDTRIGISSKGADRNLRATLGGSSLGFGARNSLDPRLASGSHIFGVGLRGPLPATPITWCLKWAGTANSNPEPVRAILPIARNVSDAAPPTISDSRDESRTLDLSVFVPLGKGARAHILFGKSVNRATNAGVGGVVLPESGSNYRFGPTSFKASLNLERPAYSLRSGISMSTTNTVTRANSEAPGLNVVGSFQSGGAPYATSEREESHWNLKSVFESKSSAHRMDAGFIVTRSGVAVANRPNPFGTLSFTTLEAYEDALSGVDSGTWTAERGNGLLHYSTDSVASFVQLFLKQSKRFVVRGGLRGDFESGFGVSVSPRLSGAVQLGPFILRLGAGRFLRDLPASLIGRVIEGDAAHISRLLIVHAGFQQFTQPGPADFVIHSGFAEGLVRPQQILLKGTTERTVGDLMLSAGYTRRRDVHLLGSRRIGNGFGAVDVVESNRSATRDSVDAHIGYRKRQHSLTGVYEWNRSYDNSDGPFTFPERQDDLRREWARTSGLSPHRIAAVGNLGLPASVSLTVLEAWRGPAPFNITSGLDPRGVGLYTDRGGRPRNSGRTPPFQSLSCYAARRFRLPTHGRGRGTAVPSMVLGIQGDNLLGNKNYTAIGSVTSSPNMGRPLAGSTGRAIRFWLRFE